MPGYIGKALIRAGVMTSVFSDEERETITDLDHTIICPVSPGPGSEIR